MKSKNVITIIIIFSISILTCNAQDRIKTRNKFIWDNFDSTSTVTKDSILQRNLQGNWIANKVFTYGDYQIGCQPQGGQVGTLEIKGDNWRNTLSGDFHTFQINQNMIIFETNNSSDTAYINRITQKELTISYRRGSDYIQYLYRK
jgi:hypothetical protein